MQVQITQGRAIVMTAITHEDSNATTEISKAHICLALYAIEAIDQFAAES